MKVNIYVEEISYGVISVEVDDNITDEEIRELADSKFVEGNVFWNDGDFRVNSWEEDSVER